MPTLDIPPIDQPLTTRELSIWPFVFIPVGLLLIVLGAVTL